MNDKQAAKEFSRCFHKNFKKWAEEHPEELNELFEETGLGDSEISEIEESLEWEDVYIVLSASLGTSVPTSYKSLEQVLVNWKYGEDDILAVARDEVEYFNIIYCAEGRMPFKYIMRNRFPKLGLFLLRIEKVCWEALLDLKYFIANGRF